MDAAERLSMTPDEEAPPTAPPLPSVPSLIGDYWAHQRALTERATELARLREEVLAAADGESRRIVASARGEIRQALVKARRDLLELAAQVEAMAPDQARLEHADSAASSQDTQPGDLRGAYETFTAARRDARHVFTEAQSDLDSLENDADAVRSRAMGLPSSPSTSVPHSGSPPRDPDEVREPVPARAPFSLPLAPVGVPRSMAAFLVVFGVVGVSIAGATLWWVRGSAPQTSLHADAPPAGSGATEPGRVPIEAPPESPVPVAERPSPPAADGDSSLQLTVQRPSWIRAIVDGRVTSARLFEPGETLQVSGSHHVSIRAGDAGGVLVSVDGGKPTAFGADGRAATREFTLGAPVEAAALLPSPSDVAPSRQPEAIVTSFSAPPAPGDDGARLPPRAVTLAAQDPIRAPEPPRGVSQPAGPISPPQAPAVPSPNQEILSAADRWMNAYFREDQSVIASLSDERLSVSDERTVAERRQGSSQRSFADASVQIFGESAIFTARLTDGTSGADPAAKASEAFVSQIWTRRSGTWRLTDVRIVSGAALSRTVR